MEKYKELLEEYEEIEAKIRMAKELVKTLPMGLPGVIKILSDGKLLFDVQGWAGFWEWRKVMGPRLLPGSIGHRKDFDTGVITREAKPNYFSEPTMGFFYTDGEWPSEVWEGYYLSYSGEDRWHEELGIKWVGLSVCICGTSCKKVQVGMEPKYEWQCEGES